MVVCPVCEHSQAGGSECEVCGRPLQAAPGAAPPSTPALDGLESTLQAPVPAAPADPVPGLELTGAAAVPAPAEPILPELEFTRTAPVDPPVAPLEVERGRDGAAEEERTPYPAVVVCRYCRTEAVLGARICDRCGMRLPTAEPPAPEPEAGEAAPMCSCGTPIRGSRCPSCGARTASEPT